MVQGLPPSRIVNVQASFTAIGAQAPNTNSLLVLNDDNVISVGELIRTYSSAAAVAADFVVNSPVYGAALVWFSRSPQPTSMMVGRCATTATAALLQGGVLTQAQQVITNFSTITNGGVVFNIDGTTVNLTALDFAGVTNLNGVASIITAALGSHGALVWNGQQFTLTSATTGAGTAATGTVTFSTNPANNDTLTLNGETLTFVSAGATGHQINIGATAADTVANLLGYLLPSTDAPIVPLSFTRNGTVLTVISDNIGTVGNAITMAKSSTAITLSGGTLTGGVNASAVSFATAGAGEDISGLLNLTATTANFASQGAAAQTWLQGVLAMDQAKQYFFCLTIASANVHDIDHLAVAAYIETSNHVYAVSTQETTALSAVATNDVGYQLQQMGLERTWHSFSSYNAYSALVQANIVLTVDYTRPNSTLTAANKQIVSIPGELLSTNQANALDAKRYNYCAVFSDGVALTQNGTMSGAAYIDEIVGLQALQNDLQNDELNFLIQLPKVPQTDGGMHQLTNANEATLARYVTNGFIAPGYWGGEGFGALNTGDFMPKGYYAYREPIVSQSSADRALRKAVPGTIAIKLAGAVHKDNVLILVNR